MISPFHLVPSPSRSLIHKTKVKSVLVTIMTTIMVPIMVMRIVMMMIIMNSNELWQNGFYVDDYVGSTADYYDRGPYETTTATAINGNAKKKTFTFTFLCHPCTTTR